jgi:integrase/recombinase XerD
MKITIADWDKFKQYLYTEKGLSRKPSSHYSNRCRFNIICRLLEDNEWSRENFRALIVSLEEKGNKDSTINKVITMGRYIDEYFGTTETSGFKYRKEKIAKVNDLLTPKEIKQLAEVNINYKKFKEYINKRQKALIMLLGTTGCRISEALGLTWDELYSSPIPHAIFTNTKNGEDREVPLGKEIYEIIASIPKRSNYIFNSGRNKHFSSQDNNFDLKRRAKACGIEKRIYNHLFRHSYISTMLEQGASESDVMKIVGHKDYKSLLRYKNSRLSYYLTVIHFHPLLSKHISWNDRVTYLRKSIHRIFSEDVHEIKINEKEHCIIVKVNSKVNP